MKPAYWALAGLALLAGACRPAASGAANASATVETRAVVKADLRDYGAAPELNNTVWLNRPRR